MSEWTPGPWNAEKLNHVARENERPWVGRLAERRYAALSCGETQAEAVANARLIAAAPDLYEALEGMMRAFSPFPREDIEGWREEHEACEAARLALAKARGEAQ